MTHSWQRKREAQDLADRTPKARGKSCHWARYAVDVHRARAASAHETFLKWIKEHTLKDFEYADGNNAWLKAIQEVQKVFPGTAAWLESCSWAEGRHGRWVGYAGVAYSTRLRDSNTVGGNMQFRFGTHTGMFRRAAEFVIERGYRIPHELLGESLEAKTRAWRSALGQALAAAWARFTGNDDSHWSASWDNGCR